VEEIHESEYAAAFFINYNYAKLLDSHYLATYARVSNANHVHETLVDMSKSYKSALAYAISQDLEVRVDVLNSLGLALMQLGNIQDALQSFEQILQLNNCSCVAHGNIALAYNQFGKHNAAIKHLRYALDINPNDANAHHNIGNMYQMVNDIPQAIHHWKVKCSSYLLCLDIFAVFIFSYFRKLYN